MSVLAPCLLSLAAKYFKSERAMRGSLVIVNLVPTPKSFLQRRILEALNEDERHLMGLMVKDAGLAHRNASRVTDRAQNYLFLMLKLDDLTKALKQWRGLPTWNPLAQTVIVLMDPIDNEKQKNQTVKKVFDDLFENGIIFANTIYQMSDNPLKLIVESWFPYFNQSCASKVENIHIIDECVITESVEEEGEAKVIKTNLSFSKLNQEKYPKIPLRLHGCIMNVSTFIWEPFVVGNDEVESGLEILMLQTITKQMELKLKFNILSDLLLSKKITDDNQTGIYADLIQK